MLWQIRPSFVSLPVVGVLGCAHSWDQTQDLSIPLPPEKLPVRESYSICPSQSFIFFFCFRFNRILFNFSDAFVATNSSVFTFRLRFCWNYLSFCFCRFCCHRCFAYTRLKHAFYSLHYLYGPLPISTIGREWVWESKRRTTTEGGEKQTRKDLRKIERNIVWKMEIDG